MNKKLLFIIITVLLIYITIIVFIHIDICILSGLNSNNSDCGRIVVEVEREYLGW